MVLNHLVKLSLAGVASLLVACSTTGVQEVPKSATKRVFSAQDLARPRQIEIFFDGTANDWAARTNVRRRFEMIAHAEDPARPCLYIEGVGTETLTGKALGLGMKEKVLLAYKYLARHWRPAHQDKILIFGFSRGAFQARMLAGLMAHCGLPRLAAPTARPGVLEPVDEKALDELVEKIWELNIKELKDPEGQPSSDRWVAQLAANRERTRSAVGGQFPQFTWENPRLELLGLWDTVPGLSFTELTAYGQPVGERNQRYKVSPYPNTRIIVHALALDEKRSKFSPLLVGPPVDPKATDVFEVWFPGAHADVGGGYEDSNDVAGVSFSWMHRIMVQNRVSSRLAEVYADPLGVIHHPEDAFPNNLGSKKVPRTLPKGSMLDASIFRRANGDSHLEQGPLGNKFVPYRPANPIEGTSAVLDTEEARRVGPAAYLARLGLVLHQSSASRERKLPEGPSARPLEVEQMVVKPESAPPPAR